MEKSSRLKIVFLALIRIYLQ